MSTLVLIVMVVILPLGGLMGIVTAQAIKVGQTVTPGVQEQIAQPGEFHKFLSSLPFYDKLAPYSETIWRKAGESMFFFGTLGGIIMFGVMGMIIGPIVAALFITILEIYGVAFKDILPQVASVQSTPRSEEDPAPEDHMDIS